MAVHREEGRFVVRIELSAEFGEDYEGDDDGNAWLEAWRARVQPRLVRAAHEFEAQMMKELLRPMTSANALTGEDDDEGGGGALGEFASEALGRALSEQGGFGMANRIIADLSHSGNQRGSLPVTATSTPIPRELPSND